MHHPKLERASDSPPARLCGLDEMSRRELPIAEALRLIRTRAGLTQTAAAKRAGAPDFRTLSHWETRRKMPSLKLLASYLEALALDFHDLQDALDQIAGVGAGRRRLEHLTDRVEHIERRLGRLEANR